MLSDSQVNQIVTSEADNAISFIGGSKSELAKNRATLMDYYNQKPFGDEIDGQSKVVTSDVADVVEWMTPSLLRIFTQGRNVATFTAVDPRADEEAMQKTEMANHEFLRRNKGVLILHNMIKDALLQYTGVVKVTWDDSKETSPERYRGLSQFELAKAQTDENLEIKKVTENDNGTFDVEAEFIESFGRVRYDNIPPEEFLVNEDARDFNEPRLIGHRTPKTRSQLIEMGFDEDIVNSLPADQAEDLTEEKAARRHDLEQVIGHNPSNHRPNDMVFLGEYYIYIDVDEDGVTELWQVFHAGNKVLGKTQVNQHPFCVIVPVPIPHRAIGTCPAAQAADIQWTKSTLVRGMLNNIWNNNYSRVIANRRVNMDDLLTPRAGGVIRVKDDGPIGDSITPLVTVPQSDKILQAVEYMDGAREIRTGVSRFNQGLDAESLNKTATGFLGIKESSQQRLELIARLFSESGVKDIFIKTIKLFSEYQDTPYQIRVSGQPMEIDPTSWRYNTDCYIDVGLGSGDRVEKINNLYNLLLKQERYLELGYPVVDMKKLYNTLSKLINEISLKDESMYFNDPEQPQELVMAEIERLTIENQLLQEQMQNPLVEAEQVKQSMEMAKEQIRAQAKSAELAQKQAQHDDKMALEITKLELEENTNLPGGLDERDTA